MNEVMGNIQPRHHQANRLFEAHADVFFSDNAGWYSIATMNLFFLLLPRIVALLTNLCLIFLSRLLQISPFLLLLQILSKIIFFSFLFFILFFYFLIYFLFLFYFFIFLFFIF